jgi:hypothetical protein
MQSAWSAGGINFPPHNVSEIPVAECDTKLEREIVSFVDRILAAKRHVAIKHKRD